jgi:glycine cleavage system H lipoate-binding protein
VNATPHDAWMIRLRVTNTGETASLLDATQYAALTTQG